MGTATHSTCVTTGEMWLKIILPEGACVEKVVVLPIFTQSDDHHRKMRKRMDGTDILVKSDQVNHFQL